MVVAAISKTNTSIMLTALSCPVATHTEMRELRSVVAMGKAL